MNTAVDRRCTVGVDELLEPVCQRAFRSRSTAATASVT